MAQARPPGPAQAQPLAATIIDDQELRSVQRLLTLLDKTFRTTRTYGLSNQLAQKFIQQLYDELTALLAICNVLSLVVQRFELYYQGSVVYQKPSPTENFAFKLYAAGVRELSFSHGLSCDDLASFVETLGAGYDLATSDGDFLTRLWEKNLSAISIVKAEEIARTPESDLAVTPRDSGTLNSPVSRLSQINETETTRQADEKAAGSPAGEASQVQISLPAFEVSPEELDRLALEIKAESLRENSAYLLEMLKAIVASEKSADVLFEVRDLFGQIFESLIREGNWKQLSSVVDKLREVQRRPDQVEEQKTTLTQILVSLHAPEQIKAMESRLNADPQAAREELLVFLLHLSSDAVPSLCKLLGNLQFKDHRLTLCEALAALAKDKPESLTSGLTDSRWYYVRNLLFVIGRLRNPSLAASVEPLAAHPDIQVRREALKTLGILGATGKGNPIVGALIDPNEGIRNSALNLLKTGKYATPFSVWAPVVAGEEFLDRSLSEIRTTFQVMSRLVGEEAVPYWCQLLTQRLWTNRKKKQALGALAAEALGQIGTPAAIAALEAGQKRFNRAIRNACAATLATLRSRQQPNLSGSPQ